MVPVGEIIRVLLLVEWEAGSLRGASEALMRFPE
jgi:hypothetical protein